MVMFVTSGSGSVTVNGVEFELHEGSLAWLQSYHTYTIEPEFGTELNLNVCVYDYPLSSYLVIRPQVGPTARYIMQAAPVVQISEAKLPIVRRMFAELEAEGENVGSGSAMIKVAVLGQIVYFFINGSIKRAKRSPMPEDLPLAWCATLYIAEHYREPLTAAEVAEHFGVTVRELNRELRKVSTLDFSQTLNRTRVNIAAGAMFFEDVTFSYLWSSTGFATEGQFYRTFKQDKGTSPNEYRQGLMCDDERYYGMVCSKTVVEALNFIQENYATPITQKQVAQALYTSESLVCDKFRESFGMSVRDVIEICRVRHSEPLLLNTDLPVIDIALRVGFNSAKVYSSAFHRVRGMTPPKFRELKRGQGK